MPTEAVWVDTETDGVKVDARTERHVLRFGWAAYRRTWAPDTWTNPDWYRFTEPATFWTWMESLLRAKGRLYVFAHNWAFDGPVLQLFTELPARGWKLTGAVVEAPPVILTWKRGPHTLKVVDTLNIWRVPLAKVGEHLGLAKLKMPAPDAGPEAWDTYARRDVEVIMEACLRWWRFLRENDLGGFAPTLAAQALRTFRHRFMDHPVLIDAREDALELAREALHGGRTECFTIGKVRGRVFKLDVNSQYPAVMSTCPVPIKLLGVYRRPTRQELTDWVDRYAVCARVSLATREPAYGVVHDNRLVFPVGRFTTALSTPELELALERGHLVNAEVAAVYERAVLFEGFVDYFYRRRRQLRAEGDEVGAWSTKILMNSLYGKFGQRGRVYEIVGESDPNEIRVWTEYDTTTGQVSRMRSYGGVVECQTDEQESRDSHPAIAAHVTAYARMQLWRLIELAGPGAVHYCDTDSLWTTERGYKRLIAEVDADRLGALKLEGVHEGVTIHGPKDYVVGPEVRIKGVRKSARKVAEGVYEQDRFSSLKGLLRTGDLSAPTVTRHRKVLRRVYTKGTVGPRGRVSPLTLPPDGGP